MLFRSVGTNASIEHGIVFFHAFVPTGTGKTLALQAAVAMASILELQTLGAGAIRIAGASPPSPVEVGAARDAELKTSQQPGGNYYRCSGSAPFIVISKR